MILPQPRSTRTCTLFPYTTPFRSRRNAGLVFLYLREDALAGLQIVAAGLGQAQATGAAVEQLDPETGLQRIDMLACHRWRHFQMARRRREAACRGSAGAYAHASDSVAHRSSYSWLRTEERRVGKDCVGRCRS